MVSFKHRPQHHLHKVPHQNPPRSSQQWTRWTTNQSRQYHHVTRLILLEAIMNNFLQVHLQQVISQSISRSIQIFFQLIWWHKTLRVSVSLKLAMQTSTSQNFHLWSSRVQPIWTWPKKIQVIMVHAKIISFLHRILQMLILEQTGMSHTVWLLVSPNNLDPNPRLIYFSVLNMKENIRQMEKHPQWLWNWSI